MDFTEIILGTITALIAALIPFLVQWLKSKTSNEKLQRVITEVGDAIATAADSVNKTYVAGVKAAKADGKLDDDEKCQAMEAALDTAYNNISAKTIAYLENHGIESAQYLESKIEAYLSRGW